MMNDERRAAKARVIASMRSGQPWDEAARNAGLRMGRATAYRLCRRARDAGDVALRDGRGGQATKVRGAVRQWLEEFCRGAPRTPSHRVQVALRDRFGLTVSVSQINRVRATLGLSSRTQKLRFDAFPPCAA